MRMGRDGFCPFLSEDPFPLRRFKEFDHMIDGDDILPDFLQKRFGCRMFPGGADGVKPLPSGVLELFAAGGCLNHCLYRLRNFLFLHVPSFLLDGYACRKPPHLFSSRPSGVFLPSHSILPAGK